MPHAKIDVAFLRDHFAAVPDKTRPAAVALYLQLVLTSAELLLDGRIPKTVVEAGASEIGISRSRYARRDSLSIATSLVDSGLVEITDSGLWILTRWQEHHNARAWVDDRRKADADRKRETRKQLTIGDGTPGFHSGRPADVRNGQTSDSRAHTRTRSESESEDPSSSSAVPSHAQQPDDDDLRLRLEHLGVNGRALTDAAADPARADAWLTYADQHANGNRAGYFATAFATGSWPPTDTTSPPDPADRRDRYLRSNGYLLPDDELEYQLRQMGAADDDIVGALETAHDLRRDST